MISRIPPSTSCAHAPLVGILFSEDLSVYYYVMPVAIALLRHSTIRLQSSRSPLSIATRAASLESRFEGFVLPCIRRMTNVDPCVLGVSPKEAHQSITRYRRFSAWKMCRGGEGATVDITYQIQRKNINEPIASVKAQIHAALAKASRCFENGGLESDGVNCTPFVRPWRLRRLEA